MPAQPSLAAPRDFPGRRHLHSVPFGGKSGLRKLPKDRPKLTKLEKKALRWAQKHPDNGAAATYWTAHNNNTVVTLFQGPNDTGTALYPATYGNLSITTSSVTTSSTVVLPMWAEWNANWYTANTLTAGTAWLPPRPEWGHWQGQGNQADLWYNPNDRVQRDRQERTLQTEAQYQQQRMERVAREAENTRLWEAGAPERAAAAARRAVADAAEQEARKTALKRSYDLLFRHLTDDQKNMLESENRFLITAQSGRMYEIRRGLMHNIFRLDDQGRAIEELCCYIPGVPEGDSLLGQMLHLMANEDDFRRTANRWELRDMSPVDRRLPAAGRVRPSRILVGRSLEEPQRRVA